MVFRVALVLACLVCGCWAVHAEPSNILVGDLTFNRPEGWNWEAPPAKSSATAWFVIPDESGDTSATSVRFHYTQKDGPMALEAWRKWFPKDVQESRPDKETVANRVITYYRLAGTYVQNGKPAKSDHTLVAAVIPSGHQYVHLLLVGPTSIVNGAVKDFKAMIAAAIKEAE